MQFYCFQCGRRVDADEVAENDVAVVVVHTAANRVAHYQRIPRT
jgi:hypothetical protein